MKEYNWREEREKYRTDFQQKNQTPQQQDQTPQQQDQTPQQQDQTPQQTPVSPAEPPRDPSAGKIIAIISVLVVIALVAVALVLFVPKDGGKKKKSRKSSDAESSESAVAGDSARKLADAAEENKNAVGVVVVSMNMENGKKVENPIGTAWAFSENKFATNAHVVQGIEKVCQNARTQIAQAILMDVAKEKKLKGIEELAEKVGEEKFKKMVVEAQDNARKLIKGFSAAIYINGEHSKSYPITHFQIHQKYGVVGAKFDPDVAILTIQGTHEKCFKIATESSLHEIKAGDPVAFLGFPMENLADDNVNLTNPIASMQTGNIVAVTDFELKDAGKNGNQLIRHNLPATGGASGSPIFNADGEVIALFYGGNVIGQVSRRGEVTRVANAALINYAARVDLLSGMNEITPIQKLLK